MSAKKPPELKKLLGTDQPCRIVGSIVPKISRAEGPKRPAYVTGLARRIWESKLDTYRMRMQSVEGCEDTLAQYCILEARLIEDYAKKKLIAPAAYINAYRIFAAEFFDTPASQIGKVASRKTEENPYKQHGK